MANTTANDWDESSPAITHARRAGAVEILSLRQGIRLRMAREHETPGASGVGGEHKQGSAKSFVAASAPTLRPDGSTSLNSGDSGRLWIDSDDGRLKYWNGSAWADIIAPATEVVLSYFHSDFNSASTPLDKTGLTNGDVYLIFIYGTVAETGGGSAYTVSITVNGVTRTIPVANHPDGTAPFMIPVVVTVSSSRIRISSASNVTEITGMTGVKIG